jgi:Zn-dependent protease
MDPGYLIYLIPVMLFALSFHEMSHAWVAMKLGDPTARDLGRVTLNPLRHLDPVGTLMVVVAGFGWARPVPVNEGNLVNPHRDGLWIAAAGPGANFLTALASGLLMQFVAATPELLALLGPAADPALNLLAVGIHLNLALAVFNLLPLHPLDGSRVVKGLLSPAGAARLARLDPLGPILLLLILVSGRVIGVSVIGSVMMPIVLTLRHWMSGGLL